MCVMGSRVHCPSGVRTALLSIPNARCVICAVGSVRVCGVCGGWS